MLQTYKVITTQVLTENNFTSSYETCFMLSGNIKSAGVSGKKFKCLASESIKQAIDLRFCLLTTNVVMYL